MPSCLCVRAGRKGCSQEPPAPRRRRLQGLPAARGRFHFLRRQAICLDNPKGNHLAKLLVSKQFTSLVFKQTPTRALCLVPGRGRPLLLRARTVPAPTQVAAARAAALVWLQTTLGTTCGPQLWQVASGPRPVALSLWPALAWPWTEHPVTSLLGTPPQTFRQTAALWLAVAPGVLVSAFFSFYSAEAK